MVEGVAEVALEDVGSGWMVVEEAGISDVGHWTWGSWWMATCHHCSPVGI